MSAGKKKRKTPEKVPAPIKIKKEKTEDERVLHPLSHYVDDRLEMIKQIFSTLKPKTITNLAPDFLKNERIEHIEELCLAELVCISKKRLHSIINATPCPSDTETSSDSDVQHEEEHVSLEEISSCSEIEDGPTNGVGKRKSHHRKVNGNGALANGIKVEPNGDGPESPAKGSGQMSVLELLELQARARAIRSQLALEPITKIELNSDEENGAEAMGKSRASRKANNDVASGSETSSVRSTVNGAPVNGAASRPRLKRHSKTTDEPKALEEPPQRSAEADQPEGPAADATTSEPAAKERSATPDLIPIVPVPETVEILDSSDDDAVDEAEERKEEPAAPEKATEPPSDVEIEEGEISESDGEDDPAKPAEAPPINDDVEKPEEAMASGGRASPVVIAKSSVEEIVADDQASTEAIEKPAEAVPKSDDTEEDIDDVISLEGGDLESEMIEHLAKDDDEVISFESSDNEAVVSAKSNAPDKHSSESWNLRFSQSDKMQRVLAASRLSKRVRDNIKKSKQQAPKRSAVVEPETDAAFASKHEDGSMQQYKELIEFQQQKQQPE